MKNYLKHLIAVLFLLYFSSISCFAEEPAQSQSLVTLMPEMVPVDSYTSGGLTTRNTLTGDWGGQRQALAEKGIFVNLGLTQVVQGLTGGVDKKTAYTGSADLWLHFDTDRLGFWPGGLVTLHTEGLWGNGPQPISTNAAAGSIAPVNFDATMPLINSNSIALSEAYLTQALSDNFIVMVGQIDGASLVDSNAFAGSEKSQFLNGGLKNNLMLGTYAPYTAATFAGIYRFADNVRFAIAALSPGGEATDWFKDFFKDVTVAAELGVGMNPGNLPGNVRFDFVWTSEPRLDTGNGRIILPRLITGQPLPTSNSNWMFNVNFDQYLYTDGSGSANNQHMEGLRGPEGIGIFGRVGYGGSSGNLIRVFGSFGIGGRGLIPTRPNDRYGVGWYYMDFAPGLKRIANLSSENGVELFYNFALTPWAQLTGDVQWVTPAQNDVSDPWVLGGRLQVFF